jgi:hypothetical protein
VTVRDGFRAAEPRLVRLWWLVLLALPVILAACGQNGSNSGGY